MTWNRHNEVSDLMVKCFKWLGTFSLYLICVYWATEAVIKYLDEPSSTAIQYSFGEDGKVPNFPAITFCDPELTYPTSLASECGIQIGKDFKKQTIFFSLQSFKNFLWIWQSKIHLLTFLKFLSHGQANKTVFVYEDWINKSWFASNFFQWPCCYMSFQQIWNTTMHQNWIVIPKETKLNARNLVNWPKSCV